MPDGSILALGEPMVEFNQTGDASGRSYLQGFGGDTSNFAISAARQGARAGYVSARRRRRLRPPCCATSGARKASTRAAWRPTTDALHRDLLRHPRRAAATTSASCAQGSAASRHAAASLPRAQIEAASVLHLSGISLAISETACDTCYAAIGHRPRRRRARSFDTNLRLKLWPIARARAIMNERHRAVRHLPAEPGRRSRRSPAWTDADALVDHCLRSARRSWR